MLKVYVTFTILGGKYSMGQKIYSISKLILVMMHLSIVFIRNAVFMKYIPQILSLHGNNLHLMETVTRILTLRWKYWLRNNEIFLANFCLELKCIQIVECRREIACNFDNIDQYMAETFIVLLILQLG